MKGYVPFVTGYKIEDENHFLLDCKAYSQIRDVSFSKRETKISHFMNSSDYLINFQLISFIYLAMLWIKK